MVSHETFKINLTNSQLKFIYYFFYSTLQIIIIGYKINKFAN